MSGLDRLLAELRQMADGAAGAASLRFRDETRPRLAQLLLDAASVQVRAAAGQDVTTATIALEASMANLLLEERTVLQTAARDLALRAAIRVIGILAGA